MVDFDYKAKRASSEIPNNMSPRVVPNKLNLLIPRAYRSGADATTASSSACSTYEHYLRLPELRKLWACRDFPDWKSEPLLKPALQALEITFRFVSTSLTDPRPYTNRREWTRRLESLAASQIELIAAIFEDEEEDAETRGTVPIVDVKSSSGVVGLSRGGSSAEVWRIPGEATAAVSQTSEASLLPRLLTWQKSSYMAKKLLSTIESEFTNCPFTLGLGEPNLSGKPNLEYDLICKPNEINSLKKAPSLNTNPNRTENPENQALYQSHQILECWISAANELVNRVESNIETNRFHRASLDCYVLEQIWKLLAEIEDLHLLMDPEDFLKLKIELGLKSETAAFCFRSKGLVNLMRNCKDLKHKVPYILGVEVDPDGGPRIQESAMRLYAEKKRSEEFEKIHLLQGLQAVECGMKRFFFAYRQVLVVVMGSLEANANRVPLSSDPSDSLSQIFLEPTYFPSLDAAKTFLGDMLKQSERRDGVVLTRTELGL